MMRNIFVILILISLPLMLLAQNVGIGTINPIHAKLEVHGVAGAGKTSGIFGSDRGISLQKNIPAIGFNQYNDDSLNGNGRYLGPGYAAVLSYRYNDPGLSTGIDLNFYPSGATDASVPAGTRVLRLSNNGRLSLMTDGNSVLEVGRSTGSEGTAMFQGTNYHSHINYSTAENTYIRAGKSNDVFLNDINGGKVIFGEGGTRVGINTASPVYTLEVRQVAGTGLRMGNNVYPSEHWEWRVAGSPANFILFHEGVQKNYFSPTDGSMHPSSDGRLKTNVHGLYPVLAKILMLKPVSYEMVNDNPEHIRSIGFIAQQVAPYFPELAPGDLRNGDTLSLNYSGFNVVAIKGIQEEQEYLNKVEAKINETERRVILLEKKISAVKLKSSN